MNSTYGHGDVSNKMKTCRVSPLAFTAILSLPFTLSPGRPCIKAGQCPECGEPSHAWEMWLSPHSEKPVGSKVGEQDPRPWIGSPVGNQACIVPRLP